jgi:hypothetical protein
MARATLVVMRARVGLLVTAHVALVIASVFIMDWVISGRSSADLWAASACSDALCRSRPLDDMHASTTIWHTLLFSTLVVWQGGSRALGFEPSRPLSLLATMVGAIGAMSALLMAIVFSRHGGLTSAPFVLAAAYLAGFVALREALWPERTPLATARRVASVRASRQA